MDFKEIAGLYDIGGSCVGVDVVDDGDNLGDKSRRVSDLLRLAEDMRRIRVGRGFGGINISAKDEVLAAGVILKINELIGRWENYEGSDVVGTQVINIIRT